MLRLGEDRFYVTSCYFFSFAAGHIATWSLVSSIGYRSSIKDRSSPEVDEAEFKFIPVTSVDKKCVAELEFGNIQILFFQGWKIYYITISPAWQVLNCKLHTFLITSLVIQFNSICLFFKICIISIAYSVITIQRFENWQPKAYTALK